jgi:hypothetical protein
MAQRLSATHTDDLDGGKAAETVSFAMDGVQYEIDLSARNAKSLAENLRGVRRGGPPCAPHARGAQASCVSVDSHQRRYPGVDCYERRGSFGEGPDRRNSPTAR